MWERSINGQPLTFHLAGINNQNFLMRDEETGSFWQQISGKAISGPLAGRQLELSHSDELTFGLWKQENPRGTVHRHRLYSWARENRNVVRGFAGTSPRQETSS